MRRDVLQMTTKAGSGHPTSCMSSAELISCLFFSEMKYGVLYVASAIEVRDDLLMYPDKKPNGLSLVDVVTYPSGQPAFYLLEKGEYEDKEI